MKRTIEQILNGIFEGDYGKEPNGVDLLTLDMNDIGDYIKSLEDKVDDMTTELDEAKYEIQRLTDEMEEIVNNEE